MIYDLEQKTKKELVEICNIQIEEYQILQKRIEELEKTIFLNNKESHKAVHRAINIILEKDKIIAELEKGIKTALFGTPMDDYGNLNSDGLYGYPDIEIIKDKLSALVPKASRSSFGKESELKGGEL